MQFIRFKTTVNPGSRSFQTLLNADPKHPHIHRVDIPFRLTSTWQDNGCEIGVWESGDMLMAWAVFQPAWWNLDYVIHPSERGSSLEEAVLAWGKKQILDYSMRTGEEFFGSVELFEDTPKIEQTLDYLGSLGFKKFDWSTVRLEIDLNQGFPEHQTPEGFSIRPLHGKAEVETYVGLNQAAFGSQNMTISWRMRTLENPAYKPEIDLIIVNPEDKPVGFCICWMWNEFGQIEPLGIHPDYQGLGLGRALERYALQVLKNQGVRFVFLDHVSLNERAIALSLRTGFKQNNNALRYFINPNAMT
jgi:ribosomal protein S18 acetylase RimI-like enzyme